MKLIKYSDFLRLTNNQQIVEGLKVDRGGVWRDAKAFDGYTDHLTGEEAAALEWEPHDNWSIEDPLVRFPCTLESLIRGLGPYGDVVQWDVAIEYSVPNWEKWQGADKVEIWEAVALSLSIEPTLITSDIDAWANEKSFNCSDVHTEFRRRLIDTLKAKLIRIEDAHSSDISSGNVNKCKISLREFVEFVLSTSWEAPSKLTDLLTPLDPIPLQVPEANKQLSRKSGQRFSNRELLNLLDEYEQPGMSIQKLASKHGISRQAMSKRLAKAKKIVAPKMASPFDPLRARKK